MNNNIKDETTHNFNYIQNRTCSYQIYTFGTSNIVNFQHATDFKDVRRQKQAVELLKQITFWYKRSIGYKVITVVHFNVHYRISQLFIYFKKSLKGGKANAF